MYFIWDRSLKGQKPRDTNKVSMASFICVVTRLDRKSSHETQHSISITVELARASLLVSKSRKLLSYSMKHPFRGFTDCILNAELNSPPLAL